MQREIATQGEDLPHGFTAAAGGQQCWCGREAAHEIHDVSTREIASETTTIERVTGS